MVNENHTQLLEQILDLLDTACQASLELLELYSGGETAAARTLLDDLRSVVQGVASAQEPLLPQLEHAYTTEMLENVEDTLEDIQRSMEAGNAERAAMKMEFQLFPFLRQLKEGFYFWGAIYPDKNKMSRYYQEEFAEHYRNFYQQENAAFEYKATVIVVAYNHLEMTKQCVESVLQYTDFEKLNAQLILVDHGSSDGTLEYFESLSAGIVVHYKRNMRGTMFCALPQLCNSEYYVHVANDTVVTKDWLEILLTCADSDVNIAFASPATCNISNLQAVSVPTSDCKTLVRLAQTQNRSNPSLWNDRARVLPAIGLYRISAINQVGYWDPVFYTFDFMDDDFSLRVRRHGYRQILCDDVMCYHRGSATVKTSQIAENTLGEGRRLFWEKHQVDAWGNGFCYDMNGLSLFDFSLKRTAPVNILGLDCGFGDTTLQIRNQLRRMGQESKMFHITTDERYLPDLRPSAQGAVCVKPELLLSAAADCFAGTQFDYIFIGQDLSAYFSPYQLLEALSLRMKDDGELVTFFSNPYFSGRLYQMLQFSLPDSPVRLLHPAQVKAEAERCFASAALTGVTQPVKGLKDFVIQHYGKKFWESGQKKPLEIMQYYVKCRR